MMSYNDTLDKLGYELKDDLATDVILQSLPVSYEPFIMNFHMNSMEKFVAESHGMLKTAEDNIKKTSIMGWWFKRRRKRENVGCLPRAKARKRFLMSPQSLRLRQKASLVLLLMRKALTTTRRDIGSGTIRSIYRSSRSTRRRREVRLSLQV
jgi:hypothetical protein